MSRFDYLISKIQDAEIREEPFRHIYIENFFTGTDFEEIVKLPEIDVPEAANDSDLFEKLHASGYKIINFPGCITDRDEYISWHENRAREGRTIHTACEGFGVTLRLKEPRSELLAELDAFLADKPFNEAIARRFDIDVEDCNIDGGIQKYLDGYEISPHPDIRRKAATFMVNINPHADSESRDHHTHYLKLSSERAYVRDFWEANEDVDRCWVPWDWCDVEWTQPANNSIVIFSPSNNTMHGVKARYDHLNGQRTQLYGNLWYNEMPPMRKAEWEALAVNDIADIQITDAAPQLMSLKAKKKLSKLVRGVKSKLGKTDSTYFRREH